MSSKIYSTRRSIDILDPKVLDEKSDKNIQNRINPEYERLVPHLTSKDTIPIKDIIIKERHRKEFGDIDTLADNINNLGLLQPIVINNENNELIDGQRRILAFESLGKKEIPCFKVDLQKDIKKYKAKLVIITGD